MAAMARDVLSRARRGDRRARRIVTEGQRQLAAAALEVARALRLGRTVNASWAGSVLADGWYRAGLIRAVARAGLPTAGAGQNITQARQPAIVPVRGGGRAVIFACGAASSGIPPGWAATASRPGVDLLPSLSGAAAADLIARVQAARQPGDIVVVSVHWGANWGYTVADDQVRFAHQLIDAGADLIHGHSSHHPRPIEVYRGKLVLYGCGDAINDYEGISRYENFRGDLRLLYFASVAAGTGTLAALHMVPMQATKMRLNHASAEDRSWLRAVLQRISQPFSSQITHQPNGTLVLQPPASHHPR